METTNILNVGATIMIIGMGTVFSFLTIMIFAMKLTSIILKIINKYFPEEIENNIKTKSIKKNNEEEIAIAIAAAYNRGGV
ncbi:OadG family protein [bacterium]|nr:OadG family protein [bacterium]